MKRFYLGLVLGLSLLNMGLFSMESVNKDHVVITIHDSKGKEVAVEIDRSQQDKKEHGWLTQDRKIVLGMLACIGLGLGIDMGKCMLVGCAGLDSPWPGSQIGSALVTGALLKLTAGYKIKNKFIGGLISWVGVSTGCLALGSDLAITTEASLYYTLFSPFFGMKLV